MTSNSPGSTSNDGDSYRGDDGSKGNSTRNDGDSDRGDDGSKGNSTRNDGDSDQGGDDGSTGNSSSSSFSSSSSMATRDLNERVQIKRPRWYKYFRGTIIAVNGDGTYTVEMHDDDNTEEENVTEAMLEDEDYEQPDYEQPAGITVHVSGGTTNPHRKQDHLEATRTRQSAEEWNHDMDRKYKIDGGVASLITPQQVGMLSEDELRKWLKTLVPHINEEVCGSMDKNELYEEVHGWIKSEWDQRWEQEHEVVKVNEENTPNQEEKEEKEEEEEEEDELFHPEDGGSMVCFVTIAEVEYLCLVTVSGFIDRRGRRNPRKWTVVRLRDGLDPLLANMHEFDASFESIDLPRCQIASEHEIQLGRRLTSSEKEVNNEEEEEEDEDPFQSQYGADDEGEDAMTPDRTSFQINYIHPMPMPTGAIPNTINPIAPTPLSPLNASSSIDQLLNSQLTPGGLCVFLIDRGVSTVGQLAALEPDTIDTFMNSSPVV